MGATTPRRRRRKVKYEVVNLPPPWKRSLTESGMARATTKADQIAVAVFLLILVAMAVALVLLA